MSPCLVSPYRSFGGGGGSGSFVDLGEPWEVFDATTTVTTGAMALSGYDLSGLIAVRLHISGLVITTDDSSVSVRFHLGGSESATGYDWCIRPVGEGVGVLGTDAATAATSASVTSVTAARKVGNAATESFSAVLTLFAPGSTALHKIAFCQSSHVLATGATSRTVCSMIRTSTTAVTGFSVLASSDIISGKLILTGLE